jgi:hypothetical protein
MIMILYRIVFLIIAALLFSGLLRSKTLYEKITFAFVAVPFVLRALRIK